MPIPLVQIGLVGAVIGVFDGLVGLVLIALSLNGASLRRDPALLWRDTTAVAGLVFLGCGGFLLLSSTASYLTPVAPAGLVWTLAVLGDIAMVGSVVAFIRGLRLYRSWRFEYRSWRQENRRRKRRKDA